ncbi:hypothetical protein THAOC_23465, partial [Thalassiosira oceanica]
MECRKNKICRPHSKKYVVGRKAERADDDAPYGDAISNRSTASQRLRTCVLDRNFTLFSNLQPPPIKIQRFSRFRESI